MASVVTVAGKVLPEFSIEKGPGDTPLRARFEVNLTALRFSRRQDGCQTGVFIGRPGRLANAK